MTVDGDSLSVDFAGTSSADRIRAQRLSQLHQVLQLRGDQVSHRPVWRHECRQSSAHRDLGSRGQLPQSDGDRQVEGPGRSSATGYSRRFSVLWHQPLPEKVAAASSHFSNPTWGGFDPAKNGRFVTYELILGGTGARASRDGCEAMSSAFNASNIPVEAQEAVQPIVVERFELIPDSGGPGSAAWGLWRPPRHENPRRRRQVHQSVGASGVCSLRVVRRRPLGHSGRP